MILEVNNASLKSFRDEHCPYFSSYRPELEVTNELYEEFTKRFQKIIGVLRWSIELGRIDIMAELSCLSQHSCSFLDGHLIALCKVFRYQQNNLSKNPGWITFDAACLHTDGKLFEGITRELEYWKDFYLDSAEDHTRRKL